jgi:agmatinase
LNKKVTDHAIVREELYGTTPEPTYGGALSFMRRKYTTDMSGVDVAVTGIPLDTATTNRPGARFGPRAIRAASSIMAWEKPYGMEFDPFDKLAVVDAGDCFFDHGRPENTPDEIEAHAFGIIDQGPALLSLGGDHFVSYPLLRAHQRKHGGALSLLHFDAHSDTWASVQIGIRTTNPDTLGFNIIDAPDVHASGVEAVVARTREILGDRPVYLTFDIDCLDPSHAPGTGTPVCGGLTTHQAMAILRGLAGINVVGMDVVEVAPAYDVGEITALAGAHLAMEMLYLYARRPDS